jgi:deoxyribonuclease V
MRVPALDSWPETPQAARMEQRRLAPLVVDTGILPQARLVAGVDVAFQGDMAYAAAVMMTWPELAVVSQATACMPTTFPYLTGLLSFRELPVMLAALGKLAGEPDLLVVDGNGQIHPRNFGLACHLGVMLDCPTIGCAKSRLCGTHAIPGLERGEASPVWQNGEVLGLALRSKAACQPIFVSVGHRLSLNEASRWILLLSQGYRLPAPIRLADKLSKQAKPPR